LFKRSAVVSEVVQGPHHPDTAAALNRVVTVSTAQGKTADALAYSRHATAAVIAAKKHGAAAWTFHNRAAFDMPSQISLYRALSSAQRAEVEGLSGRLR